jgi:hypothetical protein
MLAQSLGSGHYYFACVPEKDSHPITSAGMKNRLKQDKNFSLMAGKLSSGGLYCACDLFIRPWFEQARIADNSLILSE